MNKIFFNGKDWLGFIAPEKQDYSYIHNLVTNETSIDEIEYKRAYAIARAAALPILNPEICYSDEPGYGPTVHLGKSNNLFKENFDYDWPGDMEIIEHRNKWGQNTVIGYELSLPNSKDGNPGIAAKFLVDGIPGQPEVKDYRQLAHDEIGKAWNELKRMGYENDLNVLAVMHELQSKFK